MNIISKIFRPISIAAVLLVGGIATADTFDGKFTNPLTGNPGGAGDKGLSEIIDGVLGFVFFVAIIVCPILILWGAFNIATASGDQKRTEQGKKIITYAVVGLLIIALSAVIKAIIFDIVSA